MQTTKRNIKLVWDINQIKRQVRGVEVCFAPQALQPFSPNVIVEEQDTARILGEISNLSRTSPKPPWVLANQLEQQLHHLPGEVIFRQTVPVHLQAIIYDLDQDPIWQLSWIEQALKNILHICQQQQLDLLQLPVLGQQYAKLSLAEFTHLLHQALLQQDISNLKRIWVTIPDSQLAQAISILQSW